MSNDASKRQGWRTAAGGGPTADNKSEQGKRGWQKSATPEKASMSPAKKRKIKLLAGLGALAVVAGAVVAMILWLRPAKTACLVLIGAGYETNMAVPHNAAGWNGLLDLQEMAEAGGGIRMPWVSGKQLRLQLAAANVRAQTDWDEEIWPKILKRPKEQTMILFLSMHGGADQDGAYLLADDPYLKKKIYVESIVDKMKDPALEGKNKVLIVDASHIVANWQGGILFNDFARRLKQLKKKIENVPNLVVICSSGVDQRSWVSPEWQRTIFAHYVIEGIQGAADRNSENNRVTAWELFKYVKNRVAAWSDVNRDQVQIPFMLGAESTAKDIELVQIKERYSEDSYTKAPNYGVAFDKIKDKIGKHWSKWSALRQNVPHPAIYSPHGWRHYQDTLVRYEELIRLGDPTKKADELSKKLSRLAQGIGQWRQPIPNALSLANALPMPSVLGVTPPWDDGDLRRRFQGLVAAPEEKFGEMWKQFVSWYDEKTGSNKTSLHSLLLLEVTKIALRSPVDKNAVTAASLKRTGEVLKKFFKQLNVPAQGKLSRNAEGHYAVMLDRDHIVAPKSSNESLLQLALQVRLLAEETACAFPREMEDGGEHPYSEVVFGWIKTMVEQADVNRRKGEDLLLGQTLTHWKEARRHLTNAKTGYDTALAKAAIIREALKTRDRVAAELPYFARWAAGLAGTDDKIQSWIGQIETASEQLDQLVLQLAMSDDTDLAKLTNALNDGMKELHADFLIECEKLRDVQLHAEFHRIQNALATPLLAALQLRNDLVRTSSTTSNKFHEQKIDANKDIGGDEKRLESLARRRGETEGRMALASLRGELGNQTYVQLFNRIKGAVLEDWRLTYGEVGEEIQGQWLGALKTIRKKWNASIQEKDLAKAASLLNPAESACRCVTLGDVDEQIPTDTLGGALPVDPVQGARRLRLYEMLTWQAKRAWLDHWFLDTAALNATFYGPACKAFLKDAETLAAGKSGLVQRNEDRKKAAVELAKQYTRTVGLKVVIDGKSTQPLIGDRSMTLKWNVSPAAKDLPEGIPVYSVHTTEKVVGTFEDIKKQQPTERRTILQRSDAVNHEITTLQEELATVPLVPTQKMGEVKLRVLFRGQRVDAPVTVMVQDVADVIATRWPPPEQAKVAVYMRKGDYYGALCIALDFSGSIGLTPDGNETKNYKEKRIRYVRDAFEKALRDVIPKGTPFSILGFNTLKGKANIKFLRRPLPWQRDDREIKELLQKFDYKFKDEVEDSPDWTRVGTPIALTLGKAAEEGFPSGFKDKGPKILFVLTDGHDTFFQSPKSGQSLRDYVLEKFGSTESEIEVNMVCFANQKTAAKSKQQFGVIEQFGFPNDGVRGNILVSPEPEKLSSAMEESLRPKFRLKRDKHLVKGFEKGFIVRPVWHNRIATPMIDLPFAISHYRTFIPNTQEKSLYLSPGELVLLEVFRDSDDFLSIRQPVFGEYVEEFYIGRQRTKKALPVRTPEWAASVLQHQYDRNYGKLTQLITLETLPKHVGKSADDLRHIYPSLVWIEVDGESGKAPGGLRWHQSHSYPAPAFRLHAGRFGVTEKPKLKVWFLGGDPSQGIGIPSLPLADLKAGDKKDVAGASMQVVKAGYELRYVTTGPDKRQLVNCFVLQIDYDPARPVMIQQEPKGTFRGEEHRYFTEAGRYTALFWSPKTPNLDLDSATVRIISIQRLKNEAMYYEPDLQAPAAENSPPNDFRVVEFQK